MLRSIPSDQLCDVTGGAMALPRGSVQISKSPNIWRVPWQSAEFGLWRKKAHDLKGELMRGGWHVTSPMVPGTDRPQTGFWHASPMY